MRQFVCCWWPRVFADRHGYLCEEQSRLSSVVGVCIFAGRHASPCAPIGSLQWIVIASPCAPIAHAWRTCTAVERDFTVSARKSNTSAERPQRLRGTSLLILIVALGLQFRCFFFNDGIGICTVSQSRHWQAAANFLRLSLFRSNFRQSDLSHGEMVLYHLSSLSLSLSLSLSVSLSQQEMSGQRCPSKFHPAVLNG